VKAALLLAVPVLALSGCEMNGLTTRQKARDIQRTVERICGKDDKAELSRGGVRNIMLMDKSEDDGIVTCMDGTNHYFDG
jgi:hypothetical protein